MHSSFGNRVNRTRFKTDLTEVRSDVDDLASTLRKHNPGSRLAGEEHAFERRRHCAVVFVLRDIESHGVSGQSRVVYENVHGAKRLFGLREHRLELTDVANFR